MSEQNRQSGRSSPESSTKKMHIRVQGSIQHNIFYRNETIEAGTVSRRYVMVSSMVECDLHEPEKTYPGHGLESSWQVPEPPKEELIIA